MKKIYLILLLLLLILPFTYARSFSIPETNITYNLNSDGVVNVSENLTYNFKGCFSEIYLQKAINLKVLNAIGFCENKECVFRHDFKNTPTGDQELVLKGDYCDESVTVNFSYNLINVVNHIKDASQFFYILYGSKTSVPTALLIDINGPGNFNDTNYFIHSEDYNLVINNTHMILSKNVRSYEPMEINLLMPKEWFVKTDYVNDSNYSIVQIYQEEQNWNKDYDKYIKSIPENYSQKVQLIIILSLFLIPVLFLLIIWKKYGQELSKKKVNFFEEYQRDVPYKEHDPLTANYFLAEKFSDEWFSSGIMYLVWKGVYTLEKEGKNYFLQKTKKVINLPQYIAEIDEFLFLFFKNDKFNVNLINKKIKGSISLNKNIISEITDNFEFKNKFMLLYNDIKNDYDKLFFDNKQYYLKKGRLIASIFVTIYLFGCFIFAFKIESRIPLILLFVFLIGVILTISIRVFITSFGRFTKEGRIINLKWKGFKKYITDFSDMKNHPPKHVILWEEFIVYATAFGVADKVSKNLKILMPKNDSNFSKIAMYSAFATSSTFSNLSKVSSSGGSSATGGGGGFGGGGGGGGSGAR